jgi:hypothetical protein
LTSEDFGRARDDVGGRIPDPTLCENDELEVILEALDVLRDKDEYEDVDGVRAAANATELLTAVLDRGAACVCLYGSPARSIKVFRFGCGSGTASGKLLFLGLPLTAARFDAGRLRPYWGGGSMDPLRALLIEALISVRPFTGEGG